MTRLNIWVLGPPRIELDGQTIDPGRRKSIALVVYLAVTRQPQSRDTLATMFWPEDDQQSARASLRRALSSLTLAMGREWIDADREMIALNLTSDVWIDLAYFRRLRAERTTHPHAADVVCDACLVLLEEAVQVYQSDFLAGFSVQDSATFEEWQLFEAEQLRNELIDTLKRLVQGYNERGDVYRTIAYARRWLAYAPLEESIHRYLMELYIRSNQKARAVQQYEDCKAALQEIDALPERVTTELYESIRDNRLRLARHAIPADIADISFEFARKHNLPLQATPFLGRSAELSQLADYLHNPDCRLITILGSGGIGKTRLAIEAARAGVELFQHGVYFIPLTALNSPELLLSTIASGLGITFQEKSDLKVQLLNYLHNKQLLLVLDNFEHILDAGEALPEILANAPAIKVIATSRERLALTEEWLFNIDGLPFPADDTTDTAYEVEDYAAIQLFIQSARRVQPQFSVTENSQLIGRICRLVEGFPLAIELAAGWLWTMTCEQIVQQIEQEIDFLATSLRNVPDRHRSIRAVFDYSLRLLTPQEQQALARLSVFRGTFSSDAALQVTGTPLWTLASLVDKSLVRVGQSGRYDIHELFRQFAEEKLRENAADEQSVRDAHSQYFADLLQANALDFQTDQFKSARDAITLELGNVRAAWSWAVRQKRTEDIQKGSKSLEQFYWSQGWFQEGITVFETAADTLETANADLRIVQLLASAGWFYLLLADWQNGEVLLNKSLSLSKTLQAQTETAFALNRLGYSAMRQAAYPSAIQYLDESIALCRHLNDKQELGFALVHLANVFEAQGQYAEAAEHFEMSLHLAQELDNPFLITQSLNGLGDIAYARGDYVQARLLHERTLAHHREMGIAPLIAQSLIRLGWTVFRQGDYDYTQALFLECLTFNREIGDRRAIANTLNGLGAVALNTSVEDAKRLFAESLAIYREINAALGVCVALSNIGRAHVKLKEFDSARQAFQESLEVGQRIGNQRMIADQLSNLGSIAREQGDLDESERLLSQALELALSLGADGLVLEIIVNIASLKARIGSRKKALELLGVAVNHPAIEQDTKDIAQALLIELGSSIEQVSGQTGTKPLEALAKELIQQ